MCQLLMIAVDVHGRNAVLLLPAPPTPSWSPRCAATVPMYTWQSPSCHLLVTPCFAPFPQLAPLVSTLRHLRLDLFSLRGDEGGWRALLRPLGEQLGGRAPASAPDLMAACADALVFAATRAPAALQVGLCCSLCADRAGQCLPAFTGR